MGTTRQWASRSARSLLLCALGCGCAAGEISTGAMDGPPTRGSGQATSVAAANQQTSIAATNAAATPGSGGAIATAPALPATAAPLSSDLTTQSRAAFESTVYVVLRQNCSGCHSQAGTGQLPLHSDADVTVAFEAAQRKVNLRQPESSRFIRRLAIDHHHCWSDCGANSGVMRDAVLAWAAAVAPVVPPIHMPVPEKPVDEAAVLNWISADMAKLNPSDAKYMRYTSLHELMKMTSSQDDLNTARAGISKALNSTARYAPKIVNPVAIDPYSLVYRFDVRDYWSFTRTTTSTYVGATGPVMQSADKALQTWDRIAKGNTNAEGTDAKSSTFPNIAGFHPQYVEALQLVYTLTRPDVYNEIMSIPFLGNALENELQVDHSKGAESYQFMTVNDAITINERLMYRANTPGGFYWRSVDQFAMTNFVFYDHPVPKFLDNNFSQIVTTRLDQESSGGFNIPKDYDGSTGLQAQASEVIFQLPNGLQGYAIFGAGNQRRVDAFVFIVVDPRRPQRNLRLLNGASCIGCHGEGMNRASDDMLSYVDANPSKLDAATVTQVRKLYPGTTVMRQAIEGDRKPFEGAMSQIREAMIVGTADKNLYTEPVIFMAELAQAHYSYAPTESN